jgi:hypothetical protein
MSHFLTSSTAAQYDERRLGRLETDDDEETCPCPYCGRDIYDDAEQCPYCQNYIEDAALPAWRSTVWIRIVKITAVVLLIAILAQVVLLLW